MRRADGERLLVDALRVRRALEIASRLFLERVFAAAELEAPPDAQQPADESESSASASKTDSSHKHQHHRSHSHDRHTKHSAARRARAEVRRAIEELGNLLEKFYALQMPYLIRYFFIFSKL